LGLTVGRLKSLDPVVALGLFKLACYPGYLTFEWFFKVFPEDLTILHPASALVSSMDREKNDGIEWMRSDP